MALAFPRTSAPVIPFPGAAAAPVVNPKRRLRYSTADRNVTHIEKLRVDRAWRLRRELDSARQSAAQAEAVLQQAQVAPALAYDRLPGTLFSLQVAMMKLEELLAHGKGGSYVF